MGGFDWGRPSGQKSVKYGAGTAAGAGGGGAIAGGAASRTIETVEASEKNFRGKIEMTGNTELAGKKMKNKWKKMRG